MTFPAGSAIGVTDPSLLQVAANSSTTSVLTNGAVDNEAKTAITTGAALAKVTFTGQLAATGKVGAAVYVYRRDLAVDGVKSETKPSAANRRTRIASIYLPDTLAASTEVVASANGCPLQGITGKASEFYIGNDTGVSLSAGWTLKVTPMSYKAQEA